MEKTQKDGKPPKKPIGRPPKKLSITSPSKTPSLKNIAATFSSPPQNKDLNTIKTASPIRCYKCREVCLDKESFTDEDLNSIECDFCGKWFHKPCTNLTTSEWDLIKAGNESITFCCDGCLINKGQNNSMFNDLKTDLQKMIQTSNEQQQKLIEANNAYLIKSIQDLKTTLFQKIDEKIDNKMKEFSDKNEKMVDEKIKVCLSSKDASNDEKIIEEKIKVQIEQSFDELKDREERKNNLIIFNLKESIKEDVNEATNEDLLQLKEVLKITNPEMTDNLINDLSSNDFTRLGKKTQNPKDDSKIRPIKLQVPNEPTKYRIIKNTYKLKSCVNHPKIGIKFDLTRQQQAEDREMRQELVRRKAANEDVMIFRGRIIERSQLMKLKNEKSSRKEEPKPSKNQ